MACPKRVLFKYSEESMQSALHAIREENMAVSTACKMFNVPRTSVRNRLSGKTSDNCRRVGPDSCLGAEVEKKLVKWLLDSASRGFPINREGLLYSVQKLVEEFKIQTPFVSNIPGRKWFDAFLKRNPIVSRKHAEFINKARAAVTERSIRQWFFETKELLGPDFDILSDPNRIFNMDETAIFLSPKGNLVLGEKGKGIYDITSTSEKDNVTTLIVASASGQLAPPLTIFKFQRLPKPYLAAAPKNWEIGISETGWMQSKQFYEYFANIFVKFLADQGIPRPVIIFMDGHASHLSLNLSNFCRSNGIILVCLPPNTTHILQPLDVAFFFPLKAAWKKLAKKWQLENGGKTIQKKDVPAALNSILIHKDFSKSIQSGFRASGLYPFDENAPNYAKCVRRPKPNDPIDSERKQEVTEDEEQLKVLENHLQPDVLLEFERTFSSFYNWNGEEKFLELYNVWKTAKEKTIKNTFLDVSLDEIITQESDFNSATENNVMIFDFPEFYTNEEVSFTDQTTPKINILQDLVIKPSILPNKNVDVFSEDDLERTEIEDNEENVQEEREEQPEIKNSDQTEEENRKVSHEIVKNEETMTEKDEERPETEKNKVKTEEEKRDRLETKNNEKSVEEEENGLSERPENKKTVTEKKEEIYTIEKKKQDETLPNNDVEEIKENSKEGVRFFKKRSVSEVLKDLSIYPEENSNSQTSKRKRLRLPSVMTHDKWIELMEAKEKKNKSEKTKTGKTKTEKIKIELEEKKTKAKSYQSTGGQKVQGEKQQKIAVTTELTIGTFVILKYDNEFYPAKIVQIENDEFYCCAMTQSCGNWKWPEKNDLLWYKLNDILMRINEPKQINSRGIYAVPELLDVQS